MNDILERYLNQEFTPKTKNYYTNLLLNFEQWINNNRDKNIDQMELTDVQQYYKEKIQKGEWLENSAATFLTVLQGFCRWLLDDTEEHMIGKRGEDLDKILQQRVRLNKIIKMKKPKILQRIKTEKPVFLKDIRNILITMYNNKKDNRKYSFMRMWLLDWFGCRVGELVSITPSMIKLDDNGVYFDTEKTLIQRMNYYDDFTKQIINIYLKDNSLLNIGEDAMWKDLHRYSKQLGFNIDTRLGRQSFNTNMDRLKDDPKLNKYIGKKYGVTVDERFVKVISGHTIRGLGDMTMVYKYYPLPMIKEIMIDYHYLKPLEKHFKSLF